MSAAPHAAAPAAAAPDRRRQWLISRGLLSPNPGPSRRLAGLLPRVGHPPSPPSQASVDLRANRATPVVVARPGPAPAPPAPRAVSLPSADPSPPSPERVARAASTRAADRPASPPGRRRFLRRPFRRQREPASLSRKTYPKEDRRQRTVYTVVDRDLPRGVLQGHATYDESSWNEYRQRIDRLAEDERFMEYLTAPVQPRSRAPQEPEDPGQLAVNKLYPLAFIRLLEAHAKCASESSEPCDPAEELHRYDDPPREDEDRLERTQSSGLYDMGRFRTVGGGDKAHQRRSVEVQLVQDRPGSGRDRVDRRRPYHASFLSKIGRENRSIVPVC